MSKVKENAGKILSSLLTILCALFIGGVFIALSGNDPLEAFSMMFRGAFGSTHRIFETLVKAVPLFIMALGTSIAFKNNMWNIGGDGQFTIGAIFCLSVGIYLDAPAWFLLPLSLLAAFLGGAVWGGLAGWLKSRFHANEVISTLMLNYVAGYLLAYLVYGPMMDPAGKGFPQTPLLPENLRLPLFVQGLRLHYGVFLTFAALAALLLFWRSTLGYRIELVGQGEAVAQYAGINVKRTLITTMILSGGLTGIAAWNEVYGVQYRLLDGISSGYGNLAIVVALLGNLHPIGITVSAFFFASLIVGGNTMQRMTGVPYSIVDIIQGLIIIFVISRAAVQWEPVKKFFGGIRRRGHAR